MRVLGIGECMIEMAPEDDGRYHLGIAGDTFNTCWYLKQIGRTALDVGYVTAVGDDEISRKMRDFVQAAGIDPIFTLRQDRTVGLYLIALRDGERNFSYWRAQSAARTLADDLEELPGVNRGDLVVFSGITLAILPDAGRQRLLDAIAAARALGVRIAFDPNIRPALWDDRDTLRHWITAGGGAADIVLPSFDDETAHFGDSDPEAVAHRYLAGGAELVVVKNGASPVLARSATHRTTYDPPPVARVVDTTAAGDSFNAGFLYAQSQGADLDTALARGCALSAHVIGQRGALVPTGDALD